MLSDIYPTSTVELEIKAPNPTEVGQKANALQQLAACSTETLQFLAEIAQKPGAEQKLLKNKTTIKLLI